MTESINIAPADMDATLPVMKVTQPTVLQRLLENDVVEWGLKAAQCAAPGLTLLFVRQCTEFAVNTAQDAYEWVGDHAGSFATRYLNVGLDLAKLGGSFAARHLEVLAVSSWELVYAAGVYIADTVVLVVPLIQSMLGQVADLALSMMTFILFLLASSIIIGTTSLLNNALHGRWEVVNHRCASSLAGAAGWLAVIPYVGPGIAAAGRSAATGMQR